MSSLIRVTSAPIRA